MGQPQPSKPGSSRRVATLLAALLLFTISPKAHAGGPGYVAGSSYFDRAVKGLALTWEGGQITYYTDQGALSPVLDGAAADALVADAWSRWTSIQTVAVSAINAGQLAENVIGASLAPDGSGGISMPPDLRLTATDKPLGIIYDADGTVTDALLGAGAGSSDACVTNAVFGGPDNFSTDGHFLHAFIVLNGNCVQTLADEPDFKYRLVRTLGRVLGLDWSQANLNPSPADYNGLPLMHAMDPETCVPVSNCYPAADQPKMDDRAALSRLYPVTEQNQAAFPGKIPFRENTVRVHGSVYFTDQNGFPAQPMQGVNVIARWIDPNTLQASRTFVASSVSGFLFRGNAGNPANGFSDSRGQEFDRFGSDETGLEGLFDLGGLEIPDGSDSAQYQIYVEPLDPFLSSTVGPYAPWQVQPSGAPRPVTVNVNRGEDVAQDILMQNSATERPDWYGSGDVSNPSPVPPGGDWSASLSGYGNTDYFHFSGQANRTLSVEVTALSESGASTDNKARPVIGIWQGSDPSTSPAPAATEGAFNSGISGMTRLTVDLGSAGDYRFAIADQRGDGRPDYRYHARLFYGDNLAPARTRVRGSAALTIQGLGFHNNTEITVGSGAVTATLLAASPTRLLMIAPPSPTGFDGVQDVLLTDPATGASSAMSAALIYGAAPDDTIKLLFPELSKPTTPIGAELSVPISFQVIASDGVSGVAGADVGLVSAPAASLSACGGGPTCTVQSDENGVVTTRLTVRNPGAITMTAQLAPGTYSATPGRLAQATVPVASPPGAISLSPGRASIPADASFDLPLTVTALSNGAPAAGKSFNVQIVGPASLSPGPGVTDGSGNTSTVVHLAASAAQVDVILCLADNSTVCADLRIFRIASSGLRVQPVAGTLQFVASGQPFQPVSVRVIDAASGNLVPGATVLFNAVIGWARDDAPVQWIGDNGISHNPMPVILGSFQATARSDKDGVATIQVPVNGYSGPLLVLGSATAGAGSFAFELQSLPAVSGAAADSPLGGNPIATPVRADPPIFSRPRNRKLGRPFRLPSISSSTGPPSR